MNAKNRIIFPLDNCNLSDAAKLVTELSPLVGSFKWGYHLMYELLQTILRPDNDLAAMSDFITSRKLIKQIYDLLFWDGKLCDIPDTVAGAVYHTASMRVRMLNVHCLGGPTMMKKALANAKEAAKISECERPLVLGVTILTSLGWTELKQMGFHLTATTEEEQKAEVAQLVTNLAALAQECGLDGVVASGHEVSAIRARCGKNFRIVVPAIRPLWAQANDQIRTMTPGEVIKAGADELVIGRPISKPPKEIGSPAEAVRLIVEEIEAALAT